MDPNGLLILSHTCISLNVIFIGLYIYYLGEEHKRRWWIHPINRKRNYQGFFVNIFRELKFTDHGEFFKFTRMWPQQFDKLVQLIPPKLIKSSIRTPISPEARLAITLSYFAHEDSIHAKAWEFRIGKSTTKLIVHEVCRALWNILQPIYLPPLDEQEWLRISRDFELKWQFAHCLGALDGCHIPIRCPPNSGSTFYCFKKYFSINLMGICDANYKFTWVDVGQYGSVSDSGVWANTVMAQYLMDGKSRIPHPEALPGSSKEVPYFFVADEGFPLRKYIMLPYPRRELGKKERVYNYRLSQARRMIENCFGILESRWQILRNGLKCNPENATYIVNALICLHNFIMTENEKLPMHYRKSSQLQEVSKNELPQENLYSKFFEDEISPDNQITAQEQRDILRDYFVSPMGASQTPWQWESALGAFNINIPHIS